MTIGGGWGGPAGLYHIYDVYDCILNYVTASTHSQLCTQDVNVSKATLPILGMLILDQKPSKKDLGDFDHAGQGLLKCVVTTHET